MTSKHSAFYLVLSCEFDLNFLMTNKKLSRAMSPVERMSKRALTRISRDDVIFKIEIIIAMGKRRLS